MKLSLFIILFAVILSVGTLFVVFDTVQAKKSGYGSAMEAHELTTIPADYFILNQTDAYTLQALSNPQTLVFVNTEKTQIDELIQTHNTNNIKYNNHFYTINFLSVDPDIYEYALPLIVGWIIWCLIIIITLALRFSKR